MAESGLEQGFVVCVRNDGYATSLEVRKIYRMLNDPAAASRHYVRIVDESGEDYLYPESFFLPIELSQEMLEALLLAG
ncbi:MAG TPA: hypothetical protein VGM86_19815 [Thermoanaerobaculia bacterium]|jgi:hypothetical protein